MYLLLSVNVALDGQATQSSTGMSFYPHLAIDGKSGIGMSPDVFFTCSITSLSSNPWWRVQLKEETVVQQVIILSIIRLKEPG